MASNDNQPKWARRVAITIVTLFVLAVAGCSIMFTHDVMSAADTTSGP